MKYISLLGLKEVKSSIDPLGSTFDTLDRQKSSKRKASCSINYALISKSKVKEGMGVVEDLALKVNQVLGIDRNSHISLSK